MVLNHLRRNVVAYLALIVALSTGTAYAAGLANGSVTTKKLAKNAVTSAKIKKNAVKSADVKDASLKKADLAPGVVEAAWVGGVTLNSSGNPSATPDSVATAPHSFTLPHAGRLQISLTYLEVQVGCSAGFGFAGLYLDGEAVPGTRKQASPFGSPRQMVGIVETTAGQHQVSIRADCPNGDLGVFVFGGLAYSLVLGE